MARHGWQYLWLGISVCLQAPILAAAAPHREVLILQSYHQGYKWTDDETRGITDGLASQSSHPRRLYIEYMGAKWAFDTSYFELLAEVYERKFHLVNFDVIVAADNDAFNFLRSPYGDVFGHIPVVFCGVNWLRPTDLVGRTHMTGVNEDADLEATLDLMLKLHPGTREISVIFDATTTGKRVREMLVALLPRFADRVTIRLIEDASMSEVLDAVRGLGAHSLVLTTVFQQDKTGRFYESSESTSLIAANSKVPVYGLWDFNLGFGIVGGVLTSGYSQGFRAGEYAGRILEGEAPESIPVSMTSPNRPMFDDDQLRRFGIEHENLPAGSLIVNEPVSFYAVNKRLVWVGLSVSASLSVLVVVLLAAIARRKRAELALGASEQKYHTLVDNLSVGVFRVTGNTTPPEGRFLQANPAVLRLFGHASLDTFCQRRVTELCCEPEAWRRILEDAARQGVVRNRELAMRTHDGRQIWVVWSATANFDAEHRLLWLDGVAEDVTERRHLELQLRQAQKMEAIGTLAGGVAHDFNNILTAIIGYGNLLQMQVQGNEELSSCVEPILSSAAKAAQLTRSLLAFSRKQMISLAPVDLNAIVEGMAKLLLRVIGEDVDLTVRLHHKPLSVLVDRGQIEQILLNLVTNARDAMPERGAIVVETDTTTLIDPLLVKHEATQPGAYAVLAVSDTGVGMDAETRTHIFEPFFTTKEVGRGTGLGLSIVYGIVKQHNGDISVYSEPGKGTTFKVYLPLLAESQAQVSVNAAPEPLQRGTETILVAEDNDEVRGLVNKVLTQNGYKVLLAADGDVAITTCLRHAAEIDLLLLDVVMPKQTGREVYDAARTLNPTVKALFMSGYTAEIIHKRGVLEEGIEFVAKPLTPDALLRRVREVLDGKRSGSA